MRALCWVTGYVDIEALAFKTVDVIVAHLPEFSFPHEAAIHVNLPVLLFCVSVAVAPGILFGLWPALQKSSKLDRTLLHVLECSNENKQSRNLIDGGEVRIVVFLRDGSDAPLQQLKSAGLVFINDGKQKRVTGPDFDHKTRRVIENRSCAVRCCRSWLAFQPRTAL